MTKRTTGRSNWTGPRRGSSTERGYGAAWRRVRERVMQRDAGLCQPCGAKGLTTFAKQVDHKVPRHRGGTDDEDNLQAICDECHKLKTLQESAEAKGMPAGTVLSLRPGAACDTNGLPLDPRHPWYQGPKGG